MTSISRPSCAICLENQDIYVKCPQCNDGNYCKSCITKLIKENNHQKCPICRREDWYTDAENVKKIIKDNHIQEKDSIDVNDKCYEILIKSSIYSLILCALTFTGWLVLFGICNYSLSNNISTNYIVLVKILLSVSVGLVTLIGFYTLKQCCCKICEYCNKNDNCNFMFLLMVTTLIIIVTLLGYCLTFNIFELNKNFTDNNIINDVIIIIVAFLSGILACIALFTAFIIQQILYKCCKDNSDESGAEICCNPLFMLVFILFSMLMTILGMSIAFTHLNLQLYVNKEHKEIIKIIIGFVVGYGIFLVPIMLYKLCKCASQLCKCASQLCKCASQLCNKSDNEIIDNTIHGEEML